MDQLKSAEIIQSRHSASSEDFHPFLGICFIAICQIAHSTHRAICEGKYHYQVVFPITAVIWKSLCVHGNGRCAHQEGEEIDKVATLADNSPSSLNGVLDPMGEGNAACVDTIAGYQRFLVVLNKLIKSLCQRSKPAVEADHQQGRGLL